MVSVRERVGLRFRPLPYCCILLLFIGSRALTTGVGGKQHVMSRQQQTITGNLAGDDYEDDDVTTTYAEGSPDYEKAADGWTAVQHHAAGRNDGEDNSGGSFEKLERRLPGALIIGVKKAGTRALLEFLRLHPDVRATGPETHFFDRHYNKGVEWYRLQMPLSLPDQITMEKTPSYFVTREVPARIRAMRPDVRLLVVVRDPVTRALSDYAQTASKRPDTTLPFEVLAFHKSPRSDSDVLLEKEGNGTFQKTRGKSRNVAVKGRASRSLRNVRSRRALVVLSNKNGKSNKEAYVTDNSLDGYPGTGRQNSRNNQGGNDNKNRENKRRPANLAASNSEKNEKSPALEDEYSGKNDPNERGHRSVDNEKNDQKVLRKREERKVYVSPYLESPMEARTVHPTARKGSGHHATRSKNSFIADEDVDTTGDGCDGYDVIVNERGEACDNRTSDVNESWSGIRIGLYARHMSRWLRHFPQSQIHVVSGEELVRNPAREMGMVQDFLGLRRLVSEDHFYFNRTKGFPCLKKSEGSGSPHCLGKTKGRTHPRLNERSLQRLRTFFEPHNRRFYKMVGRDFQWERAR